MQLKTRLTICTSMLCVTNKRTSKSDYFRNFETTESTQENYSCTIVEAASATAAAPIYFKSVRLEADNTKWVDGGYAHNRNNPVHVVEEELKREKTFEGREIGCLLSLGTGVAKIDPVSKNLLPFLLKTVKMLNNSEDMANDFEASGLGKELDSSDRYFRFNVPQGMQEMNLDDWKETTTMKALTNEYLKKVGNGKAVDRCAASLYKPDENC